MSVLFKRVKELEIEMESYLREFISGLILFREGIKLFFQNDKLGFQEHFTALKEKENEADKLRRKIEDHIYRETLIPEYRGDVLRIFENADVILSETADILKELSIENPNIPETFYHDFFSLTETCYKAMEHLSFAINNYLKDFPNTKQEIYKIIAYEKESDKISEKLKRDLFQSDLDLSLKLQIKYFIQKLEKLADNAEDAGDSLIIYSIKRNI